METFGRPLLRVRNSAAFEQGALTLHGEGATFQVGQILRTLECPVAATVDYPGR
jgi:hypothetical protein